ncbi:kinesin-like protein KIF1C isoform X1 [Dicentrarchus labrax]|uniref:Kinesin family member 16Bb n=1 Tax=Dicentrarchus labrax TaxID=13489 RepID=A0A8P4GAX1_DICLA|nr:kinesin-like protein KIF1C isoform X1 [Dicentrarchus labrax]
MASVRVAVRVRPLNRREKQLSSKLIIHMKRNTTSIHKPAPIRGDELKGRGKTFSYDFSYDSSDRGSPTFASQERIFHDLGSDVLKAAFEGFNACVFAYGQTGSGKSYTMMGHTDDKGLIPRICEGLFYEITQRSTSDAVSFCTEVSYLEIYNERVQDLLQKRHAPTDGGGLKVREHPRDGPYVENLSKHLVRNHSDMEDLIILGNANRTTASTGMNNVSSRSHAIFTINFTQARFDAELPRETLSKIHLVDLAGSERADATRATGTRLKEGANINKSLVTLGSVISALADLSVGGQSTKKKKQIFIPYRDSVLTWLLKDSLGGNSMTTMIATVSPADVNYGETLSTLRYASRAKNIVNSPTVNEDGSVKVIRELQAEVTRLRRLLEEANQVSRGEMSSSVKVEEELNLNEGKVLALTKEWTSKWGETQSILKEEAVALRKEGSGVVLDCQLPHLIGIDEDLLSTGIILYYLKEGRTLIGSDKASCSQDIVLHGPGLLGEHCVLENHAGAVTLIPQDGALCSVNGSVVTDPCQLTQGAITQLGRGTILRFNHPTEAAQLREKRQSGLPSLTDTSKSTENLSKVMLQNPGKMEEKLNQQEVEWQQVQGSLNRRNRDIKRLSKESSGAPYQPRAEEKTTGVEMEEPGNGQMSAETVESKVPSSVTTVQKLMTTAMPGKYAVPHSSFDLDGDTLQGRVSTRDGQEQERDLCHKSGPGLMSERLWRKAQSGAAVSSYKGEEVWSGDASLQQTSVLGLGDGCGTKPEGNANEIQGVVADCYKGRPDSGGSSLGRMSHLQSSGGTNSASVLPQTNAHSQLDRKSLSSQAACSPPEETTFEGQFSCGEMDESGALDEIPGVGITETDAVQNSGLGSLVSRVSWIVQDAGRLLWSSPTVLQQVREEGLQPVRARWSSHVVTLVRESSVLSVVKDSQVLSMVKGSFVFSLFKDSHIFSMVKELPLIQHIQMEITQNLQPEEAAKMIQGCINPDTTQLPVLTPTQPFSKAEELPEDVPLITEDVCMRKKSITDLRLPQEQDVADIQAKQDDKLVTEQLPVKHSSEPEVAHGPEDKDQALENSRTVQKKKDYQIFCQTLITFPESLLNLQTLPLIDLMDTLQSIVPTPVLTSQKIVALYWLNVAKCSQPEPRPALLILLETGLYTLTADSGFLVLFHHLPLLQLQEVQITLAGHSVRLMGTTEESILGVYTHTQKLTKELCWAILGVICPGDNRVSQHPLLHGDLMKMSLNWDTYVPDLLLDAGLKVCCQFQKRLADLVYLLHCNMGQKTVALGDVQLVLYTSVRVCINGSYHTEPLAQLLLTDTHLGLVQEDAVFHPAARSATIAPCRLQFHGLTLRQLSDVRCVLVHDEDECGAVRLDVILANVRGRGHPESVTKAATPPAHASNSSPHAEVWKLTFSCSSEAACLINHLSNV